MDSQDFDLQKIPKNLWNLLEERIYSTFPIRMDYAAIEINIKWSIVLYLWPEEEEEEEEDEEEEEEEEEDDDDDDDEDEKRKNKKKKKHAGAHHQSLACAHPFSSRQYLQGNPGKLVNPTCHSYQLWRDYPSLKLT